MKTLQASVHDLICRRRPLVLAAVALGTLLALALTGLCSFGRVCAQVRGSTLRLHVLANSNSAADQQLKLQVRDALVDECNALFGAAPDLARAERAAAAALPRLQARAAGVVRRAGYSYPVTVTLAEEYFSARSYGSYTLPAGQYRALQVKIGSAAGKNWWCVLYPPLCVPAATAAQDVAAVAWGQQGLRLVQGEYKLRFALVDWLNTVVGKG